MLQIQTSTHPPSRTAASTSERKGKSNAASKRAHASIVLRLKLASSRHWSLARRIGGISHFVRFRAVRAGVVRLMQCG
ncbi:hypothetical protein RB2739 [Rhodopirellula baltica SH 1]|uniref:Uncharacterized protein n=1 Tax=Rhodopirellula baltica (strain DSM 10527 / NCIMB 13988 / SH1) TaxID=243090 RepID=Q7UVB7_RHOBA|nr:hypothetical protein RB2739 [Rhodopirellula baltica SH 1]